MRKALLFVIAMTFVASIGITRGQGQNPAGTQTTAVSPLPMPTFHHIIEAKK